MDSYLIEIFQIILPLIVGISLGLIGGGGTVIAVPILIYIFHEDPKSAIAMSLGIVSVVSLLGSYSHWKKGNVRLENAAFFTPFAMLGAFIGAKIAHLESITGNIQMLIFGTTVLASSFLMVFKKSPDFPESIGESPKEDISINNFLSQNINIQWKTILILAVQGIFVGILTGLVGVGGGFLIVPALVFVGKLPIREAIGTSLVIIFFNSLSGFIGYLGKVPINWLIMLQFVALSTAGVILGVKFADRVPRKFLQKIFGVFLFGMGIWLIYSQISH
ncbi:MAG: sulfite exporter TauE/SafE family protein [Leptospira sp.]|nr:sulfite exporter TauE/SafE family protein [Leptospira sp.]